MTPGVEKLLRIIAERWRLTDPELANVRAATIRIRDLVLTYMLIVTLLDNDNSERIWLDSWFGDARTPRDMITSGETGALLALVEAATGW